MIAANEKSLAFGLALAVQRAPRGISTAQLRARMPRHRSIAETESALKDLREQGSTVCTNGLWWWRRP